MAKDKDVQTEDDVSDTSRAVNDAWTGMLAISFLALAVGTGLLAWDYVQYNEEPPKRPTVIGTAPPAPKVIDPNKDAGKDAAAKDAAKDAKKDMP